MKNSYIDIKAIYQIKGRKKLRVVKYCQKIIFQANKCFGAFEFPP